MCIAVEPDIFHYENVTKYLIQSGKCLAFQIYTKCLSTPNFLLVDL